jgi:hypothetical protein
MRELRAGKPTVVDPELPTVDELLQPAPVPLIPPL